MVWDAIAQLRQRIISSMAVEGFDAGFVDAPDGDSGEFHTHVHLVPRVAGQTVALANDAEWVDLGV
jgi:diadenosine tetraphosphate (Ap4A) HIT family hydrolase